MIGQALCAEHGLEQIDDDRAGRFLTKLVRSQLPNATDQVMKFLVARCPLDGQDEVGHTALMRASWTGNTEIVKVLIGLGAKLNTANNWGKTALCIASRKGHAETVDALEAAGALRYDT